jgi:hypothetical protein
MPDLFTSLLNYLDSQSRGDTTAAREIRALAGQICAERIYRDPSLSAQQIRGIELLLCFPCAGRASQVNSQKTSPTNRPSNNPQKNPIPNIFS